MRLSLVTPLCLAVLVGCGETMVPPDSGPDTSCGLDCVAQARYGLVQGRCFEYDLEGQAESLPDIGAVVLGVDGGVTTLEGGIPSIQVEYQRSGMRLVRDSFGIKGGALYLYRRELIGGPSWTYRDDAGTITGVQWVNASSGPNQLLSTVSQAKKSTDNSEVSTSYTVATSAPSASDLDVPAGPFDAGLRLAFSTVPANQAADGRRVLVPGVGFVVISSAFAATGDALPRRLRRVRDLGRPDAGEGCGFGPP